jgi:hypothetical protein
LSFGAVIAIIAALSFFPDILGLIDFTINNNKMNNTIQFIIESKQQRALVQSFKSPEK